MNVLSFSLVWVFLLIANFNISAGLATVFNNKHTKETMINHYSKSPLITKINKARSSPINYNFIIEDIVRMMRWVSDDDIDLITAVSLLNNLSSFNRNGQLSSELAILNDYSRGQFEGLKSESYVHKIIISNSYQKPKKIKKIRILFKSYYGKKISLHKFNYLISGERKACAKISIMICKTKVNPKFLQQVKSEKNVYVRFWINPVSKIEEFDEVIIE
jgi:hypothetical protein